jgi:hypothetical protein
MRKPTRFFFYSETILNCAQTWRARAFHKIRNANLDNFWNPSPIVILRLVTKYLTTLSLRPRRHLWTTPMLTKNIKLNLSRFDLYRSISRVLIFTVSIFMDRFMNNSGIINRVIAYSVFTESVLAESIFPALRPELWWIDFSQIQIRKRKKVKRNLKIFFFRWNRNFSSENISKDVWKK